MFLTPSDRCPKCGCQIVDPFGFGVVIHNVHECGVSEEMSRATITITEKNGVISMFLTPGGEQKE